MTDLARARVLITGASRGVGAAAARRFAQAGADVALLARGRHGLEDAAASAREHGARAFVVPCDVGDRAQAESAVTTAVADLGGLDVAVLNAAAVVYGPFTEVDPELFDETVRTTFTGAVNMIRAVLPELERAGGTLVVTGSLNAHHPLPGFSSYAAAKHALRGLVGTLRAELAAQGSSVGVAMVDPGPIDTPLWHQLTSATGRLPRRPPEGYSAETVADGLVAAARRPRAETFLGGETRLWNAVLGTPVLGSLALRAMLLWYESGREPAPRPGALVASPDVGGEDGRLWIRRGSLTGAVRTRLGRG